VNEADKKKRAIFHQAIRSRIALIAAERGLPKSETAKMMGRLKLETLICFSKKHGIDSEWLICGHLEGLLRMARSGRMGA
jgi:hypothetical protein